MARSGSSKAAPRVRVGPVLPFWGEEKVRRQKGFYQQFVTFDPFLFLLPL